MTAPNVAVRVSGEDAGVATLLRTLSRNLSSLEQLNGRNARSTAAAGGAARTAARDFTALDRAQRSGLNSAGALASKLGQLAAVYVSIRGAVAAVARGLDVNAQLESSALGIASLITAQGKLTDSTGKALTGAEALNAAQEISADQLQKLRVAGLQTSATFVDLSRAFQTATGPGLAAGLSLDEVRETTIGLTQAAGALGVPFNQLDQEIRSILAGEIDINSRVAKTLDITNEQVKLERERGTLAVFLNEKFAAFNLAGLKAAQTFAGVTSNLGDALDLLAADATRPLFESFKKAGIAAIEGVFDLKNAKIAPAFAGVVSLAQRAFAGLGDLLARAIAGAVNGAKQLSAFIDRNREAISNFATLVTSAVSALASAVLEAGRLVASIASAAVQSGLVAAAIRTVTQAARLAADVLGFWAQSAERASVALGVIGSAVIVANITRIATAVRAAAAGFIIINAPIAAAVAGLFALVTVVNLFRRSADETEAAQARLNEAQNNAVRQGGRLSTEYASIARALADGTLKGKDAEAAQQKLKTIKDELLKLSPKYQDALADESLKYDEQARAVAGVTKEARELQRVKVENLKADLAATEVLAEAAQRTAKSLANSPVSGMSPIVTRGAEVRAQELIDQAQRLREQIAAAEAALDNTANIDKSGGATLKGNKPNPADTRADAKALADVRVKELEREAARARGITESGLKDREQANEIANAQGKRSLQAYFAERAAITQAGVDAELRELAAQRAQLAKPVLIDGANGLRTQAAEVERKSKLADIDAKILLTQQDGARQQIRLAADRANEEKALADAVDAVEARIRSARGQTLADTLKGVEAEGAAYDALLVKLGVDAPERAIRVKLFVDTESAKATFTDLQSQGQRALDAIALDRQRIDTNASAGLISQAEAQRQILLLERQRAPQLRAIADLLTRAAAALGPEAQANAAAFAQSVAAIGTAATRAEQQAANAATNIRDGFENALGDVLARLGSDINSVGEAFAALAQSVVQSIQRIVSELLAAQIVQGIGSLFGSGFKGSDIPFNVGSGFASGGYVRGPGTSTSDSIPARLSAGEYVVRAAAVRRVGVEALEAINGLRTPMGRPRPGGVARFADGGLVTSGAGGRGELSATIGLEDGLVVKSLNSRAGEAAILDVIRRNPRIVSAVLRR